MSVFKQATKEQARLRMALAGPSGSGKTYSALAIAQGISNNVALIDTEHGSAAKYADIFDFATVDLRPPYSPERYIDMIQAAADEGYDVVIIDSLTHAWAGSGGILEIVDQHKARNRGGGKFAAWKDATPRHRAMVDAILASPVHVIATMRSKQEYAMVQGDRGMKVEKLGMGAVQRDGIEYEFDIFAEMDLEHRLVVSKTRMDSIADAVIQFPGSELGKRIKGWLSEGEPSEREKVIRGFRAVIRKAALPETQKRQSNAWAGSASIDEIQEQARKIRNKYLVDSEPVDEIPAQQTAELAEWQGEMIPVKQVEKLDQMNAKLESLRADAVPGKADELQAWAKKQGNADFTRRVTDLCERHISAALAEERAEPEGM